MKQPHSISGNGDYDRNRMLKLFICCLIVLISSPSWSQEVWTGCKVKIPVFGDFQLQPEVQARFRHDPTLQSYAYLYRIGAKYRFNKTWRLGGTFRLTDDRLPDEVSVAEIPDRKRYTLDTYADFPGNRDKTTIENRLRCQVSQTRKMNYNFYARYRLGLQYQLNKKIYTTVSNEIYLEISDMSPSLNKTSVDVEVLFSEAIGVELFYTVETNLQREKPLFN